SGLNCRHFVAVRQGLLGCSATAGANSLWSCWSAKQARGHCGLRAACRNSGSHAGPCPSKDHIVLFIKENIMPSNAHLRCSFLPACRFAVCSATLFGLSVAAVAQPAAERSGLQLETVVVTATGSEQIIQDAPASITVISREELEEKAFKDVTDAIRDVPGVVVTGGGSHSDISIRGMAPKYTMILVDGKRQNSRETRPNSDGPGIEQGWLPPVQAIERIEVIRGPMSSLYGSDAMGGVINIITRKVPAALTGSLRNEITLQEDADSGNHYQSSVYLAGPLIEDRLGLAVHGQARHRQ